MIAVNSAKLFFDKEESWVPDERTIGEYPGVLPRAYPLDKQLPGTISVCPRQRRHKVVFDNHSAERAVTDFFSGDAYHLLLPFDRLRVIDPDPSDSRRQPVSDFNDEDELPDLLVNVCSGSQADLQRPVQLRPLLGVKQTSNVRY